MYKQMQKLASFQGVSASGIATAKINPVGTIYGAFIRCSTSGTLATVAQIKAQIADVVLRINSEEIIHATPTFLYDLLKYKGYYAGEDAPVGILPLYFAQRNMASDQERSLYALGMADVQTAQIECRMAATITNVANLDLYVLQTAEPRIMGQHIRIIKYPFNFATTGLQEISTLPLSPQTMAYLGLHIENGSGFGAFDYVTCRVGNYAIHDQIPHDLCNMELYHNDRTPEAASTAAASYYHLDFARSRDMSSMLPVAGVTDLRLQINWATNAPVAFNIYAEHLWNLGVQSSK